MPRQRRVEYAGAIYHVMSRGDRGRAIYLTRQRISISAAASGLVPAPYDTLTKECFQRHLFYQSLSVEYHGEKFIQESSILAAEPQAPVLEIDTNPLRTVPEILQKPINPPIPTPPADTPAPLLAPPPAPPNQADHKV